MSNAPSKPVSFSRPKVGYFSNRPRTIPSCETESTTLYNSSTHFYVEYIEFQPSVQQLKARSEQQFYNFTNFTKATIYLIYKNT